MRHFTIDDYHDFAWGFFPLFNIPHTAVIEDSTLVALKNFDIAPLNLSKFLSALLKKYPELRRDDISFDDCISNTFGEKALAFIHKYAGWED